MYIQIEGNQKIIKLQEIFKLNLKLLAISILKYTIIKYNLLKKLKSKRFKM